MGAKHPKMSLTEWTDRLKESVSKATAGGKPVGACLVPDPHTGQTVCVLMDEPSCKMVKGTFLGGPCGGAQLPPE